LHRSDKCFAFSQNTNLDIAKRRATIAIRKKINLDIVSDRSYWISFCLGKSEKRDGQSSVDVECLNMHTFVS